MVKTFLYVKYLSIIIRKMVLNCECIIIELSNEKIRLSWDCISNILLRLKGVGRRAVPPVDWDHFHHIGVIDICYSLQVARNVGTSVVQWQKVRIFASQNGIPPIDGNAVHVHTPTPRHGHSTPPIMPKEEEETKFMVSFAAVLNTHQTRYPKATKSLRTIIRSFGFFFTHHSS